MDIKQIIAKEIHLEGISPETVADSVSYADEASHGDLTLPCFRFAKELRKSPQAIVQSIIDEGTLSACRFVQRLESVGGYLNIFLNRECFGETVFPALLSGENTAPLNANGKTVCIDYSSINIAKPFHIGHLLTTAIGGSLYRIHRHLGYRAVGINYLGDWGTQFGKLISAYKRWGDKADIEARGVRGLLELYVRFHAEAKENSALDDEGRAYFKRIEDGDEESLALFRWFRALTLKDVSRVYDLLGITFDSYNGESYYNDKLEPVIQCLRDKNLLTESEGAQVVDLSEYDMPPCLILKSDGASLYATRDLATAVDRKTTYGFSENLYVVAYQQNLHFKQVFKVLELMGYSWAGDCKHIPFGMVSLEGMGALSTRAGNVVFLEDVLAAAVQKADAVIAAKNPGLSPRGEIAQAVGVGAVVFGALSNSRIKDVSFSLERCLSFDGETGPYLQYTYARCRSILEKSDNTAGKFAPAVCADDDSFFLMKQLNDFTRTVIEARQKFEPSVLARYLLDTAKAFNKFYLTNRVLVDDPDTAFTRRALVSATADVLQKGLHLLLIKTPERM